MMIFTFSLKTLAQNGANLFAIKCIYIWWIYTLEDLPEFAADPHFTYSQILNDEKFIIYRVPEGISVGGIMMLSPLHCKVRQSTVYKHAEVCVPSLSCFNHYSLYCVILQQTDAFFIMTNMIITPDQTKTVCAEVSWFGIILNTFFIGPASPNLSSFPQESQFLWLENIYVI